MALIAVSLSDGDLLRGMSPRCTLGREATAREGDLSPPGQRAKRA